MIISGLTLVSMKMILCGWINDPKPEDKPKSSIHPTENKTENDLIESSPASTQPASPLPEELIALLDQLPSWLEGMSVLMSCSKDLMHSQQQPVSDLLNVQALIKQTSIMQKQAVVLKERYGTKTNNP